jgi:hypothetical protein
MSAERRGDVPVSSDAGRAPPASAGGLLTLKATVATLRSREVVTVWDTQGLRQNERCFLHTKLWANQLTAMPGAQAAAWVRSRPVPPGRELRGAVEAFAAGEPWERFQPPHGEAMEPVFARRWAPNEAVVALKTKQTRTLGFFTPSGTFVAVCCGLAAAWHADEDKPYDAAIKLAAQFVAVLEPTEVDGTTDVRTLIDGR